MDLIGHLIGPLVPQLETMPTVRRQLLQIHPERRGRHPRSLLAQFGLTPKSRRGLAVSEVV